MKVKIGPYPDRLRSEIHRKYMDAKYGFVDWPDESEYTRMEKFLDKLDDFLQTLYMPINYFLDKRKQRINVKIDRWDTWSMDYTLAYIIVPMLKQLKERKHGAPFVEDDDVPSFLKSTNAPPKENEWDTDEFWFDRWDYILSEMIWAFEQKCRDNWEEDYYKYEEDENESLGLKLVWEDKEGRERHQERMSNGFRLFGRYYEGLWD